MVHLAKIGLNHIIAWHFSPNISPYFRSDLQNESDHDFKNMAFDVNRMRDMIKKSSMKYPNVRFIYSDAVSAMKKCCGLSDTISDLSCVLAETDSKKQLMVKTPNAKTNLHHPTIQILI